ncbi:MAG: YigZ family protein [Clostridia bacterium]|nr:YigZ family protein [Clostridia bacterium]
MFKTVKENNSAEIVEKKSKFIGNIFYIESEEEAERIIKETRKKYHDARHNCYAYKINKDNLSRFSDDGEPSGTAGAPMLAVIDGKGLSNILVIVTRYFGGILLGTGGLVRAYSDCTEKVIDESKIIEKEFGYEMRCEVSYKNLEKIKYYFDKNNIVITNSEYLENITLTIEISKESKEELENKIDKKELEIENLEKIREKYI